MSWEMGGILLHLPTLKYFVKSLSVLTLYVFMADGNSPKTLMVQELREDTSRASALL